MALARFGSGGKVFSTVGMASSAAAMLLQSDGKIVVTNSGGAGFQVARFKADGSPDAGPLSPFGSGGVASTDIVGGSGDTPRGVAIQPDGKIVVAGQRLLSTASGFLADYAIARYEANGGLDTSFDGDGKLTLDLFGASDEAIKVAVQPDGKIVLGGSARNGTSGGLGLVRINP